MKKILTIDVGIKNLAICIGTIIEGKLNIQKLELIHLTNENCKTLKLETKISLVLSKLKSEFSEFECDTVLIENQMVGIMKTMATVIYSYFMLLKIENKITDVRFVSPCKKLKCKLCKTLINSTYKDRKQLAIIATREYFEEYDMKTYLDWFDNLEKKDDIADCFLYMINYFETNK